MNSGVILCWLSVVVSLYAAYLFTFRLYDDDEKVKFPPIIYILVFTVALIPVFNIAFSVVFMVVTAIDDDYHVDSWLFKKPDDDDA